MPALEDLLTRAPPATDAGGQLPFWNDSPDTWDVVYVNGQPLPGLSRPDAKTARKIDVRSAPGSDGGTVVDKGYEPAKFTILVRIWTPNHFTAWQNLYGILNPANAPTRRNVLTIGHPALTLLGIGRMYITGLSALKEGGAHGVWESTVECVEYRPSSRRAVTRTPAPAVFAGNVDPRFTAGAAPVVPTAPSAATTP